MEKEMTMSELNATIIAELNKSRTSLILQVEHQRIEMDSHVFIACRLGQIARLEARLAELGGEFDPYKYPGPFPEQQRSSEASNA